MLAEKFDLVIVGRHHASRRWHTLDDISEMTETASGAERLTKLMLRIYGPEDFLTLWRYRFAKWLGFRWIPGAPCPFADEQVPGYIASGDELRAWMRGNGVKQAQLAKLAGVSRETISRSLNRRVSRPSFWAKINDAIARCDVAAH